jgi:type IV pilus assembly protein PilX
MSKKHLPPQQQGFVLVMTLIILVVMVISAQGLMLMARSGVTSAGNVAFRQAAVRVADVAAEQAYQWVNAQTSASATAMTTTDFDTRPGYYAIHNETDSDCSTTTDFAPQNYKFTKAGCAMTYGTRVSGYDLYYIVHRMAENTGACPGADCSGPSVTATPPGGCSNDPSAPDYCGNYTSTQHVYYRITVKVIGPRHNSRYIQTFVY